MHALYVTFTVLYYGSSIITLNILNIKFGGACVVYNADETMYAYNASIAIHEYTLFAAHNKL